MMSSNEADGEGTSTVGLPSEEVVVAPKPRGFGALSPEQRRLLGSRGGKVAHERGTANKFDSASASAAGKIPHEKGTAYRWTSEEASAAGRKGAGVSRRRRRAA
jgi:hypothetical protein